MNPDTDIPLVTVVIPTYNRMPYIMEAVSSVINQTYTNWELYVVDDGSTDKTSLSIKSIGDSRIHLVELPHKGLIGPLRNEGALKGKGAWIGFLDSDDVWMPQKLELQVKALQQSGFECCYTNFELMNEAGKTINRKQREFKALSGNIIKEVLTTEAALSIGSIILSRNLFNKLNGFSNDPRLMYRDDYELATRIALEARIIALPDILFRVREYKGRGTNLLTAADSHERSAIPYEVFIAGKPGKELERIAYGRYLHHYAAAAKINFKLGKYRPAFKQLKKVLFGKFNREIKK